MRANVIISAAGWEREQRPCHVRPTSKKKKKCVQCVCVYFALFGKDKETFLFFFPSLFSLLFAVCFLPLVHIIINRCLCRLQTAERGGSMQRHVITSCRYTQWLFVRCLPTQWTVLRAVRVPPVVISLIFFIHARSARCKLQQCAHSNTKTLTNISRSAAGSLLSLFCHSI